MYKIKVHVLFINKIGRALFTVPIDYGFYISRFSNILDSYVLFYNICFLNCSPLKGDKYAGAISNTVLHPL